MNRLENIKEQKEVAESFRDWFEDGWHRNKGSIDDLITHNKQLSESVTYLLQRLERYENSLKVITHLSLGGPEPRVLEINRIAEEALKEE